MILYYSGLSPSKATIELRSLLLMIVVIFLFNTPMNYIKREKLQSLSSQLGETAETLILRKQLVSSYLSLRYSEVVKQYATYPHLFDDLAQHLLSEQDLVVDMQVVSKIPEPNYRYYDRILAYNRFYTSNLNQSQVQTLLEAEQGHFLEFAPIYADGVLQGYLVLTVNLNLLASVDQKDMLLLGLDGFVYSSSYLGIPSYSYLEDAHPLLLQELNRTRKHSGAVEYDDFTVVYQNIGVLNGKENLLLKVVRNEDLLPKYFYLFLLLITLTLGVSYYLYRLRKDKSELKKITYLDALSGLHNRHYLLEIEKKITPSSRYFVGMLDIDHFKLINDRYGHDIGDQVIRRVANVIKSRIRVSDYAFRIGGEEFLLLIQTNTAEDARVVLERIRTDIAQANQAPNVTISGGFCLLNGSLEESLRLADSKLYEAKHAGRNNIQPAT